MLFVLTITYNSLDADILEPFMRCFREQRDDAAELLVIDNASTDGTVEWLKNQRHDRFTYHLNSTNIGFGAACNQGITEAKRRGASHILFLNHDTEFGSTLFSDLLRALAEAGAAAISPAIVYHGGDKVWYAGGEWNIWRGMISYHDGIGKPLSSFPANLAHTTFAPGCCLLMDMALFDRLGVFDEQFFVYWEDADFCRRMEKAGEKIVVDRRLSLEHKVSVTTGGAKSPFSLHQYNKNHMLFLRKHFGMLTALAVLPIIIPKAILNLMLGRLTPRQLRIQLLALWAGIRQPQPSRHG